MIKNIYQLRKNRNKNPIKTDNIVKRHLQKAIENHKNSKAVKPVIEVIDMNNLEMKKINELNGSINDSLYQTKDLDLEN